MAKKKVNKKTGASRKREDSRIYAFLTAFLSIIGFIIALILWKDDDLVMFYAKHSLVIFIGWVIVGALSWIPILNGILGAVVLVIWIISWVFALSGEKKDMWVLTDLAEKINL